MAPTPTPAQSHALSIPEIFELILLNLDIRTLLTKASRICHSWSHFINSSPRIQWALFFRPLDHALNKPKTQNPLLAETFPSIFDQFECTGKRNDLDTDTTNEKPTSNVTLTTFDMIKNPHKWDAYIRPEASWRRMLVQQPPVYTLSLLRSNVGHGGQHLYIYEAMDHQKEPADGLRMDIVFEALIFGDRWDQDEYSATQMVWGQEFLPKQVQADLELFGVRDLDLVFYTHLGEMFSGLRYDTPSLDCDVMNNIKAAYTKLGMKPKYSDEAFLKGRKSWGSLWD
uniref:F-box domain-containing protein n=1 Tax=Penicillium chrysogenum TaxID=5076 RepID=A0ABQ8WSH1_PENCH|nr:uncharacterized protein N7489_003801 [Penicillium chrysogenum]KAJ5243705.1 hypothetical protein N7489_003801 [Penicillium chrysogenum]KAJ5275696.1 hypothetical protein N7505_004241 [Penicillium chrysogenum]KAJ5286163.1 hypothetical protein N7524_001469 [Penicillium chrysogenum]KAJ6140780.1 hypothetical protein N7497_011673 [Penicillium chrysogenum]